jgi:hypothetical protein
MPQETWNIVIAMGGLLLTAGGVVIYVGRLVERLNSLESRCKEEWSRNSDQHRELYDSSDKVIKVETKMDEMARRFDRLEGYMQEMLRRMPGGPVL